MKTLKLFSIIVCTLITTSTFAQNWRLGGNTVFPFGGINSVNATNNSFGTVAGANFPINFITNGIQRMIVNGSKPFATSIINNHNMDRSGFVGIGTNGSNFLTNPNLGPYSLLHLNGSGVFPNILDVLGHHNWMKTGVA